MKNAAPSRKELSHERIVAAAARAIRRNGFSGAGVADIMKDAGLTHGGFYSHFPSREAMLAEATDRAGAETVGLAESAAASVPADQALEAHALRLQNSGLLPMAGFGEWLQRELIEPLPDLLQRYRAGLTTAANGLQ